MNDEIKMACMIAFSIGCAFLLLPFISLLVPKLISIFPTCGWYRLEVIMFVIGGTGLLIEFAMVIKKQKLNKE